MRSGPRATRHQPNRLPATLCCLGVAWLCCLVGVSIASAQANPLDVTGPEPGNGDNPLHSTPGANPISVPEFIRPGARFIYESGSSTESQDPNRVGSAGVGLSRFDIVAVTDTHVLVSLSSYLQSPTSGALTWGATTGVTINATTISGGNAFWIPKDALNNFQATDKLSVVTGPWELDGRTYDAISLTQIEPQFASRRVFDRGTGLKLVEQMGSGPARREGDPTGFNRQTNSMMQFKTFRQVNLPWLDAPAPAWTQEVRTMRYSGQVIMSLPGSMPLTTPYSTTVEFRTRGPGWAIGVSSMEIHGQGGPPSQTPVVVGAGSVGGYWMSPEALQAMEQGVIDEDPTIGCTLTYEVRDSQFGRVGVLIETGRGNNYSALRAYRLNDGALTYALLSLPELNMTYEMALVGRE